MHFLDHGPTVEDGIDGRQREQVAGFQAAYAEIYGKAKHTVLKPGDKIPVPGLDWRIVASAGQVTKVALPGGGKPNPACAGVTRRTIPRDPENGQSVGSIVGFGPFRLLDFGDLTADIEYDLMCPDQPDRDGGHVLRIQPRHQQRELTRAGARRRAARGGGAEQSGQRGVGGDVPGAAHLGAPRRCLAASLGQCRGRRVEQRRGVHRQRC